MANLLILLSLAEDISNQDRRHWGRWPARLLDGKTVGILGIGVIAEALAPKCKALGMRVLGFSAAPRPVNGFDRIYARHDLAEAVAKLDYFVLLTPLTP